MIKIEKGVKQPRKTCVIAPTLREMKVGDSFAVGDLSEHAIRGAAARLKIKVSIMNDSEGKRRCWRTA